ncbi:hypothetical protein NYA10_29710, partial [Burkholderia thailandensis]|nr:hypothetical protein [Burkholderia thailandensis]
YNTTIYALDDRYRGVFAKRAAVFPTPDNPRMLGFKAASRSVLGPCGATGYSRPFEAFLPFPNAFRAAGFARTDRETNPSCPLDGLGASRNRPPSHTDTVAKSHSRPGRLHPHVHDSSPRTNTTHSGAHKRVRPAQHN